MGSTRKSRILRARSRRQCFGHVEITDGPDDAVHGCDGAWDAEIAGERARRTLALGKCIDLTDPTLWLSLCL